MRRFSIRDTGLLAGLASAICAIPIAVAAVPPAEGDLLIVAPPAASGTAIAVWSSRAGLRLVGPGPVDRSLIVHGSRAVARTAAAPHGAWVLAAPVGGCGGQA